MDSYNVFFGYGQTELSLASGHTDKLAMWALSVNFGQFGRFDPQTGKIAGCLRIFSRDNTNRPFERSIDVDGVKLKIAGIGAHITKATRGATAPCPEIGLAFPLKIQFLGPPGSVTQVSEGFELHQGASVVCSPIVPLVNFLQNVRVTGESGTDRQIHFVNQQNSFGIGLVASFNKSWPHARGLHSLLQYWSLGRSDRDLQASLIYGNRDGSHLISKARTRNATPGGVPGFAELHRPVEDLSDSSGQKYGFWGAFRGSSMNQKFHTWARDIDFTEEVPSTLNRTQNAVTSASNFDFDLTNGDFAIQIGGALNGGPSSVSRGDDPVMTVHEIIVDPVADDGGIGKG